MKQKIFSLSLALFSLFFLSACGKKTSPPPTSSSQAPAVETSDDSSFSGSIKDLLALGKNLKCTWTFENEQTQMIGTAYVSGNKSRTDMSIKTTEDQDFSSHFISDGQTAYSWTDGQAQGFQFEIDANDQVAPDTDSEHLKNWQNEYQYKCSPWIVNNSQFEVPNNVEFVDLKQQMQDLKDSIGSVCDSLPSPQKEECLESLAN